MNDLISRQAAIDEIMGQPPEPHYPSWYAEQIKKMPSAQPEPHWIPCSERLPTKVGDYLVTNYNGQIARYIYMDTDSSKEYWVRCAIAWMPLPEPYAERRTEDEYV